MRIKIRKRKVKAFFAVLLLVAMVLNLTPVTAAATTGTDPGVWSPPDEFREEMELRNKGSIPVKNMLSTAPVSLARTLYSAETVVTFPDAGLEAAVREALDKPIGDITAADMATITGLNASERGITSLEGLEYAVNLILLGLWGNQVADLTPLAGLTNLTWLDLDGNQVTDLTPLVANTGLDVGDELWLYNNPLDLVPGSQNMLDIETLRVRGVTVYVDTVVSVTGVTLDKDTLSLVTGGAPGQLIATIAPNDATNQAVTWSSGNEAVAVVDANGVVTPLAAGTATITVTTVDGGHIATCVITVVPLLEEELNAIASVVIDNHPNARPQAGLNQAGIVYEVSVAPGITRFLAIFDLWKTVDKIGPVRSAREHLVTLAAAYEGAFAHAGGSSAALALIPGMPFISLDEIYGAGAYFYRDTGRNMPYNLYTNTALLRQGLEDRNYRLISSAEDYGYARGAMTGGISAIEARVRFVAQGDDTVFKWDAQEQQYNRYENGQPFLLENGQSLRADNVVIIFAEHSQTYAENLGEWLVHPEVVGSGTAHFYREGQKWLGEWKKTAPDAPFTFTVDNSPMLFAPGNVWALIVPPKLSDISTVTGQAALSGRADHSDVTVTVLGTQITSQTDAAGNFTLTGVPAGAQTLVLIKDLFLIRKVLVIVPETGNLEVKDTVVLKPGDANNDNQINIQDLTLLASAYRTEEGDIAYNINADFNADGEVNIQDLTLLAGSYREVGDK